MTYSAEDIAEAKQHIAENYTIEELHQLRELADRLRRPMNRSQRRALASRARKRR